MPIASDEEMADDEDYYYYSDDAEGEGEGDDDDGDGGSSAGGDDGESSNEDLLTGDYEGREAEGSDEAVSKREQVSRESIRCPGADRAPCSFAASVLVGIARV
jgi:hypothetical protein